MPSKLSFPQLVAPHEHVQLLADIYPCLARFDGVDHLQDSDIDAFRVIPRQRFLGDDIRLVRPRASSSKREPFEWPIA
jgi:hypothetical protein